MEQTKAGHFSALAAAFEGGVAAVPREVVERAGYSWRDWNHWIKGMLDDQKRTEAQRPVVAQRGGGTRRLGLRNTQKGDVPGGGASDIWEGAGTNSDWSRPTSPGFFQRAGPLLHPRVLRNRTSA